MASNAERMSQLFDGFKNAHGTHGDTTKSIAKGGKQEIKKTARTLREPVTLEKWEAHLDGSKPLGIIPIREDQQCVWACIDVDKYDIDLAGAVREIEKRKLPLVLCRSKSGGAHVYLFLTEPEPASEVRAVVKQIAASLGWGDCEIYPKQNQVLADRGDLGNWLNMPYLGGHDTERYAVKKTMAAYSLSEFLNFAEKSRVALGEIQITRQRKKSSAEATDETLNDGPPCLQHLSEVGFPDGTRNMGLFALGVFCKKKYGSKWKEMLEKYNQAFMKPPLSAEEVTGVVMNLEKKEYQYSCKEPPMVNYCNSPLCRARKFGVGGAGAFPEISGLSKLETDPPIWFLDIDDQRIELDTRQLMNYREFQHVCMDQMTVYFMPMKNETWAKIVGEAMENAIIIEASPEMSVRGWFMELLEDFCMNRHRGENKEDILLGKPWYDPDTGKHYFRLRDLVKFLEREGFREWGRNTIGKVITKELGGKKFFNIKGKGANVVYIEEQFITTPDSTLPETEKEPF